LAVDRTTPLGIQHPATPTARLNDAVGQAWCRQGLHIQQPVSAIQYPPPQPTFSNKIQLPTLLQPALPFPTTKKGCCKLQEAFPSLFFLAAEIFAHIFVIFDLKQPAASYFYSKIACCKLQQGFPKL
jgi:hypothetical protein